MKESYSYVFKVKVRSENYQACLPLLFFCRNFEVLDVNPPQKSFRGLKALLLRKYIVYFKPDELVVLTSLIKSHLLLQ